MSEGVVKRRKLNSHEILNVFDLLDVLCNRVHSLAYRFFTTYIEKEDLRNLLFDENSSKIREFFRNQEPTTFYQRFSLAELDTYAVPKVVAVFLNPTMTPKETRVLAKKACTEGLATILKALIECFNVELHFKSYEFFNVAYDNNIRKILLEWRGPKDQQVYIDETDLQFYEDEEITIMLLKRLGGKYLDHISFGYVGNNDWINLARYSVKNHLDVVQNEPYYSGTFYEVAFWHFDIELMNKMYELNFTISYVSNTRKCLTHAIEHDRRDVLSLAFTHATIHSSQIRDTFLTAYREKKYEIMQMYLDQFPNNELSKLLYPMGRRYVSVFFDAFEKNNMVVVEMLIKYPLKCSTIDQSITHSIQHECDMKMITRLTQHENFDVSFCHYSLLTLAVGEDSIDLVKLFMAHSTCCISVYAIFPILAIARLEVFKYIYSQFAEQLNDNISLTNFLIESQAHAEVIEYMIVDRNVVVSERMFRLAIEKGKCKNIALLLEHLDVDPTILKNKCLQLFLKKNKPKYLKQLLEHPKMIEYFEKIKRG